MTFVLHLCAVGLEGQFDLHRDATATAAVVTRSLVDIGNHILAFGKLAHDIIVDHDPHAALVDVENTDDACRIDVVLLRDLLHQIPNGTLTQVDSTIVFLRMLLGSGKADIEACNCRDISHMN